MTNTFKTALVFLASFALSNMALAHPGHDHEHWLSEPIHLLSVLAIIAVSATVLIVRKKRNAKR